jgi:6-pyruvoyl-tetrahydropterin synthase
MANAYSDSLTIAFPTVSPTLAPTPIYIEPLSGLAIFGIVAGSVVIVAVSAFAIYKYKVKQVKAAKFKQFSYGQIEIGKTASPSSNKSKKARNNEEDIGIDIKDLELNSELFTESYDFSYIYEDKSKHSFEKDSNRMTTLVSEALERAGIDSSKSKIVKFVEVNESKITNSGGINSQSTPKQPVKRELPKPQTPPTGFRSINNSTLPQKQINLGHINSNNSAANRALWARAVARPTNMASQVTPPPRKKLILNMSNKMQRQDEVRSLNSDSQYPNPNPFASL